MNLKDVMKRDVEDIFMDGMEFAEEHTFEGKKIKCIVDENILVQLNSRKKFEGLGENQILVFIPEEELDFFPEEDERVVFDNAHKTIKKVSKNLGIYEIIMEAYTT